MNLLLASSHLATQTEGAAAAAFGKNDRRTMGLPVIGSTSDDEWSKFQKSLQNIWPGSPSFLCIFSTWHFPLQSPLHFGPRSAMHSFMAASCFFPRASSLHLSKELEASFSHCLLAWPRAALFSSKHFSSACFWHSFFRSSQKP